VAPYARPWVAPHPRPPWLRFPDHGGSISVTSDIICRNLVTELGGELSVQSTPGSGATFRITLPAAQGDASAGTAGAGSTPPRVAPRRARVLIVDDDPSVGVALGRVLREHEVTLCKEAQAALTKIVSEAPFDVIISDLMMPGMTGMQLYEAVCLHNVDLAARMVFISGGTITPASRDFLDAVPNERIEKPFTNEEVRALVRRFIA
jgi:CheY-like chemotaxis protein